MKSHRFNSKELDLLSKTADALCSLLGKPVIAEIDTTEDGLEWVAFGIPLDIKDKLPNDAVSLALGGPEARLVGESFNKVNAEAVYECEFLWGIQITGIDYARFAKISRTGDEVEWADSLKELLPFSMADDETEYTEEDDSDSDNYQFSTPSDMSYRIQ